MGALTVLALARRQGFRIATAESCTGGMISAALTAVPGSSNVFDRGFVTYSNDAKIMMLGVLEQTLTDHGAVSVQVAREMADGALARSLADLAVSVTGIAGPGSSEYKPEGRVCFGLAMRGAATVTQTVEFGPRGRDAVRAASRDHAFEILKVALS